jgi:hypothetical protein
MTRIACITRTVNKRLMVTINRNAFYEALPQHIVEDDRACTFILEGINQITRQWRDTELEPWHIRRCAASLETALMVAAAVNDGSLAAALSQLALDLYEAAHRCECARLSEGPTLFVGMGVREPKQGPNVCGTYPAVNPKIPPE